MNFAQALTRELHRWQDEAVWLTPDVVAEMVCLACQEADDLSDLVEVLCTQAGYTGEDAEPMEV